VPASGCSADTENDTGIGFDEVPCYYYLLRSYVLRKLAKINNPLLRTYQPYNLSGPQRAKSGAHLARCGTELRINGRRQHDDPMMSVPHSLFVRSKFDIRRLVLLDGLVL
jgi:hypothetical protein